MKQIITSGTPKMKYEIIYAPEYMGQIEYQPKYYQVFIPENLGIPLWSYVEFFEDENYDFIWHIVSESINLENSRRATPNKSSEVQSDLRFKNKSKISFNFPELSTYLKLPKKEDIPKNSIHNRAHLFNAYLATYHLRMNGQWLPGVRRGIAIDLSSLVVSEVISEDQ